VPLVLRSYYSSLSGLKPDFGLDLGLQSMVATAATVDSHLG